MAMVRKGVVIGIQSMALVQARAMVVDDHAILVRSTVRLLEAMGVEAHGFTCAREAFDRLQSLPGDFDLLIVDQRMPAMSGTELIERAKLFQPNLQAIICSGWVTEESVSDAVLVKPFQIDELRNVVRGLFSMSSSSAGQFLICR